jgi:hypothetical protein
MSMASTFLLSAAYVLGSVWELAGYAVRFGWALLLPKAVLAAWEGEAAEMTLEEAARKLESLRM